MAKTKAGPGRQINRLRLNNNNNNNKKHMQNGLYVHSSPPKALNDDTGPATAKIREYIRAADVEALENVVLLGQGTKLINQHATDQRVRNFLKTVPSYMSKIDLVHDSVEKGNLRDLKALLDRRKLARSKDAQGVGLLHKAVVHGHRDIVDYLITDYPETLEVTDNDERVPLHYCAASKFPDDMYNLLCGVVQDTQVQDSKGKTAADYMSHPEDIHLVRRRSSSNKGSGDSKGKRRTLPKRNSPAHKITTPPKREGMNITGANIRIWIHDQDLARLEQIVWEGEGNRLLQETSNHAKVRQFLNLVPRMMAKIKEVHHAALKGDMETLDAKVEQPEILTAKDQNGLNPLHKSAALGNLEVSEWIVQKNQSTVFAQDRQGRTPLFYASVAKDGGEVYNMMLRAGADPSHVDKFGKTAEHYRYKPGELDLGMVHDVLNAPRSGGSTLDIPPGLSRAASNQNSRTPSRNNNYKSRNPSRKNSTGDDMRRANRSRRNSNKSDLQYKDLKDATEADIERFIRDGDLESLEYLVLSGRGSDLQGRSSWNEEVRRYLKKVPGYTEKITALHDASSKGDVKTAKRLTKENPRLSMARTHDGQVAMHVAAAAGNTPVVRHLLSLYPDAIRVEDASGRTPLHYAGLSRETGAHLTYDLLKREGASEGLQDQSGNTPLDYRHLPDKKDGPSRHLRSRGRSKLSTKDPSGGASRGASRAASRVASKGGSQGTSREPSRTNSPEEASGSKGPSRASSAAGGDEEVQKAIAAAEADEDYSLLSDMVVRGDGDSLVGHSSDDPEVNTFLENVPQHLESIDEVHDAAEAGETRKVMALLDTKKKALARDSNHCNILHKAVLHDHTDLSTQLCQKYPDLLQQEDLSGRTPLHYAAVVRGHEGHLYHTLLEAGGDATRPDQAGNNPDDYYRDPDLLTLGDLKKELADGLPTAQGSPEEDEGAGRPLTKGSEIDPASRDEGRDQLSRQNSRASVRSEFPGMWTDDGKYLTSALGDALIRGLSEVNEARPPDPISYLACCLYTYRYTTNDKEAKAEATMMGSSGSNRSGQSTIAMQTAQDNTGGTDAIPTPQTRDKSGQSVLHFAASRPHGRSAFYRLISESGCSLADRDDVYRTPRDVAEEHHLLENVSAIDRWIMDLARHGKWRELEKLQIEGYDHLLDVQDEEGNNILQVAEEHGQEKTVDFLRGSLNFEEKREWLHKAIRVGSLPHVQYIADNLDIARAKDARGRTALHLATLCEEKEIMEFLTRQYPQLLMIGDNLERSPLHYAMAVEGVDQVAKVLVQAGAKRTVKDLRGKQPSYYFMNRGEVVAMIKEVTAEE
ncbi:uncharacterized protein [Panulirus ornatus]|uniref:uncharacterized protein isoform X3 n=1 Tax=Panulirus ornatus TaxID=150431 RepID=UPI003A8A49AB